MHLFRGTTPTQLNQSHVQLLNAMFTNLKKLQYFKDKKKHKSKSRHHRAASAATNDVASDEHDTKMGNPAQWSELSGTECNQRLCVASEFMRDKALPFLRRCLNALGDDGEPLSDNAIMAEVLQYGVIAANWKNRISQTLSFPEMLPDSVVRDIEQAARRELEEEERREMRVECLPEWAELYHAITKENYQKLRAILPDPLIPSLHQMESYRTEVTTAFGDRIRWNRIFTGFQLSVKEFMPAFVMSNLLKFVAGHPAGLLDNIRVVNKILVDGFSCDNLTQRHVVAST